MSHVKIRNRKTGGVWECPEGVLDEVLDSDNPFMGSGWQKAADSAEPTNEAAAAGSDSKGK